MAESCVNELVILFHDLFFIFPSLFLNPQSYPQLWFFLVYFLFFVISCFELGYKNLWKHVVDFFKKRESTRWPKLNIFLLEFQTKIKNRIEVAFSKLESCQESHYVSRSKIKSQEKFLAQFCFLIPSKRVAPLLLPSVNHLSQIRISLAFLNIPSFPLYPFFLSFLQQITLFANRHVAVIHGSAALWVMWSLKAA